MTWILLVGAGWSTTAVAAALLLGRVIDLADRRAAEAAGTSAGVGARLVYVRPA